MLDGQSIFDSYKDCGVDWIGLLPSGLSIVKNRVLFREVKQLGNADFPVMSVSIHNGVSTEELSEEECPAWRTAPQHQIAIVNGGFGPEEAVGS
ncbi:hypothetical protein [uncultured Sulfitobacter sp.]|jgi:hypothetical protein|uniref:hypothetical protein n=1 Tax=Sulfitobacter sp. SH22 TaxID=3421172 RepID=UPI002600D947|nr:hypothetical protein [uncultured Sulfitobacter sp.]